MESAVAAVVALLACTLSVSAVSITINEHTPARLDLNIVWGPAQDLTPASVSTPGVLFVSATENAAPPGVSVFVASNTPNVQDVFSIVFASLGDRLWSSAALSAFDGVQSLSIPGENFGARFVYGNRVAAGVPDGGSTMILLAGALGALGLVRFRHVLPVRVS